MKRVLTLAALLAAGLTVPPGSAAGLQTSIFRSIDALGSPSGGGSFHVYAFTLDGVQVDGSVTSQAYGCIQFSSPFGDGDSGCGPLSVSIDPLLQTGSASGTIPGGQGTISVDLTYAGTHVNSNPPYVDAELVPTQPSATVSTNISRTGRVQGTITSSASGSLAVTNSPADAFGSIVVSAT